MDPSQWPDWLVYGLSALLVVAFLLVLYWRLGPVLFFKKRANTAQGTITNWLSMHEKGAHYYYPLITFTDHTGKEQQFRAEERCQDRPLYPVGTHVEVFYNPKNPKDTRTEYPDKTS